MCMHFSKLNISTSDMYLSLHVNFTIKKQTYVMIYVLRCSYGHIQIVCNLFIKCIKNKMNW